MALTEWNPPFSQCRKYISGGARFRGISFRKRQFGNPKRISEAWLKSPPRTVLSAYHRWLRFFETHYFVLAGPHLHLHVHLILFRSRGTYKYSYVYIYIHSFQKSGYLQIHLLNVFLRHCSQSCDEVRIMFIYGVMYNNVEFTWVCYTDKVQRTDEFMVDNILR